MITAFPSALLLSVTPALFGAHFKNPKYDWNFETVGHGFMEVDFAENKIFHTDRSHRRALTGAQYILHGEIKLQSLSVPVFNFLD